MSKKKWLQIGSIRLSEKGNLYIKLDDVSGLKDGVCLTIEKPEDKLNRLAELGYIDEDKLEERLANLPEWLKYEIQLPPQDE